MENNEKLQEIYKKLVAPFPEEKLEFRVGATNRDKTQGLALAYVSARAIQERLDEVFGFGNWTEDYSEISGGIKCTLSVCIDGKWISKSNVSQLTDFEPLKGGATGAFKRVASSGYGIGRYLYGVESQWYPIKQAGRSFVFVSKPVLGEKKLNQRPKTQDTMVSIQELNNSAAQYKNNVQSINENYVVGFGEHKGKTLKQISVEDPNYISFLAEKAYDNALKDYCRFMLQKRA